MTEITMTAQVRTETGGTTSYLYDRDTGHVLTMLSSSYDVLPGSEQSVTRGWIAPEQPQGDCVFRECWVQLLYPEDWRHGLSVECSFDYDDSTTVLRSWTADELESIRVNGRVTVGVNLHGKCARAIKVNLFDVIEPATEVDEGASDYMQPLHVTITYGASDGPRRRTLKAVSLK